MDIFSNADIIWYEVMMIVVAQLKMLCNEALVAYFN
jgi:hypothetical protein